MSYVEAGGHRLEMKRIGSAAEGRPTLVLLHEGLGSVAMWRDFPSRLAHATNCNAVVYSRQGYGKSDPITEPRGVRYMHYEALEVLPELLDKLAIEEPILVGHSDGASIALIHAGSRVRPVRAIVSMAAHVMVEPISVQSIAAAREAYETADLRSRLARHHADVDGAFWGWNDVWLDPDFLRWNIESYVCQVRCPLLVIQGHDDEYGTMEQVRRIADQAADAEVLTLQDCRHSPHKDQPEAVIEAITRFVDRVTG